VVTIDVALSQMLVAIVLECDNRYEETASHRTTIGTGDGGPWLHSLTMWSDGLRFVPEDGLPAADFPRLTNLPGLLRWGYLRQDGDRLLPRRGTLRACASWPGIVREIEDRWRARCGSAAVDELAAALLPFADPELPPAMPVVGFASGMRLPDKDIDAARAWSRTVPTDLAAGLARALLAFTLAFEQVSRLSLTLAATVQRVLGDGLPTKDVPVAAGVSKEGATAALGFLQRQDLAVTATDRTSRPTERGRRSADLFPGRLHQIEQRWRDEHGEAAVDRLAAALEALRADEQHWVAAVTPPEAGWRWASRYRRQTEARREDPLGRLPWHPMVLHRGGYPDGS
jgi:hypothetical protein